MCAPASSCLPTQFQLVGECQLELNETSSGLTFPGQFPQMTQAMVLDHDYPQCKRSCGVLHSIIEAVRVTTDTTILVNMAVHTYWWAVLVMYVFLDVNIVFWCWFVYVNIVFWCWGGGGGGSTVFNLYVFVYVNVCLDVGFFPSVFNFNMKRICLGLISEREL